MNDVLSVGMYPKMRPVGVSKKEKKDKKLSCVKLAICPDHPRRRRPLKFCVRGRVREVVIYFKFRENRSRGLGAVGGWKSPSPIDKAHGLYNSLYYRTSRDDKCIRGTVWCTIQIDYYYYFYYKQLQLVCWIILHPISYRLYCTILVHESHYPVSTCNSVQLLHNSTSFVCSWSLKWL